MNRFLACYRAVEASYERFANRLNVLHLKNGQIILFIVSLGVSWLLYWQFLFWRFDYVGRFIGTFTLGWLSAYASLSIIATPASASKKQR
jgi:hypothetical protein